MQTASPKSKSLAIGALGAAVFASACCILPLVVGFLGVGAGLLGSIAVFEKYSLVFMLLTVGLLGFAFYRSYRPAENCEPDGACAVVDPATRKRNRIFLWCIAAFALAAVLFPYYIPYLLE